MFADFFQNFMIFAGILLDFRQILAKFFRDFSKMQEQQEKIPNGQRGADSAGPTARGRQRRAGPDVWPFLAHAALRVTACAAAGPAQPRDQRPGLARLRVHLWGNIAT